MADTQPEAACRYQARRRLPAPRNQFGLPAMLAAFALLAIWIGWAEVVGDVLRGDAAKRPPHIDRPAVVFQSPFEFD